MYHMCLTSFDAHYSLALMGHKHMNHARHTSLSILIRRLMTLCVLASFVFSSSGIFQPLYYCNMMGEVGPKCCCSHAQEQPEEVKHKLTVAPCCEQLSADSLHPLVIEENVPDVNPAHLSLNQSRHVHPQPQIDIVWTLIALERTRAPPPDAPPLFIKHCAYLI